MLDDFCDGVPISDPSDKIPPTIISTMDNQSTTTVVTTADVHSEPIRSNTSSPVGPIDDFQDLPDLDTLANPTPVSSAV